MLDSGEGSLGEKEDEGRSGARAGGLAIGGTGVTGPCHRGPLLWGLEVLLFFKQASISAWMSFSLELRSHWRISSSCFCRVPKYVFCITVKKSS